MRKKQKEQLRRIGFSRCSFGQKRENFPFAQMPVLKFSQFFCSIWGYLGHDYNIVWPETQFEVWKETYAKSNSLTRRSLNINFTNQPLYSIKQTQELLGNQKLVIVPGRDHRVPEHSSRQQSSKDLLSGKLRVI